MEEKLSNIQKLSEELAKKYSALKIELETAKDERYLLKNELEAQIKINEHLLNQIKISKLARNIKSEEGDNANQSEIKSKIQEFIKEIDKCVAILNS